MVELQVPENLDPRKAFHLQECHRCHGRGHCKCSGCHGACMVSLVAVGKCGVGGGAPRGQRAGLGAWGSPLTVGPQAGHCPLLNLCFPTYKMGRLVWVVSTGLFHFDGFPLLFSSICEHSLSTCLALGPARGLSPGVLPTGTELALAGQGDGPQRVKFTTDGALYPCPRATGIN